MNKMKIHSSLAMIEIFEQLLSKIDFRMDDDSLECWTVAKDGGLNTLSISKV